MFNEIRANVLRTKSRAAYEASQRVYQEYQEYLLGCPHHSVTLMPYQEPQGALIYSCDCCGRKLLKDGSGEWFSGSFIKPDVQQVNRGFNGDTD